MPFVKNALLAVTAATIFAIVYGSKLELVSANCLGCLCEASTQCNVTVGCHTPYSGAYFCGPFLISWAYWSDAGKPVIKGDDPDVKGAFENCVNDLYCAALTVRQYMAEFAEDCDKNGAVTCTDFVLIHKLGYTQCNGNLSGRFGQKFEECRSNLFLH